MSVPVKEFRYPSDPTFELRKVNFSEHNQDLILTGEDGIYNTTLLVFEDLNTTPKYELKCTLWDEESLSIEVISMA